MERQHFDLPGAALLAVGLSALTLGSPLGRNGDGALLRFPGLDVIAAAALAGAVWVERRVPFPLLDPRCCATGSSCSRTSAL